MQKCYIFDNKNVLNSLFAQFKKLPEDVENINIGLSETALNIIGYPLKDKQHPKSIVDGQFSMPFCAAVTVKSGGLNWDDYNKHLNMDHYINKSMNQCKCKNELKKLSFKD